MVRGDGEGCRGGRGVMEGHAVGPELSSALRFAASLASALRFEASLVSLFPAASCLGRGLLGSFALGFAFLASLASLAS